MNNTIGYYVVKITVHLNIWQCLLSGLKHKLLFPSPWTDLKIALLLILGGQAKINDRHTWKDRTEKGPLSFPLSTKLHIVYKLLLKIDRVRNDSNQEIDSNGA